MSDVVPFEESSASRPRREAPLSAKDRMKLEGLDECRVDASRLKFVTDRPHVEGGFAVVCRASLVMESPNPTPATADAALNPRTDGVDVAVKMMKIKEGDDVHQVLRRAVREANIIANLNHKNIVKLEGFVEDVANGKIWLIFPWAEMGNVRDFIASEDWSIPERIKLIYDVTCGVEHLHSRNPPICHGDLKSVNILVNSKSQAVITDFGSARRLRNIGYEDEQEPPPTARPTSNDKTLNVEFCQSSNTMTFTGTKYTLRWVAPEILQEEGVGTSADIWSMGWVFYETMTGSIPFESLQNEGAIVLRIMKGEFPSLKDHNRMSPILSLVSLMMMCWEITPESRPLAERCRKYVDRMPMCAPRSKKSPSTALEAARRLFREGDMYRHQDDYGKALVAFNEGLKELGDRARRTREGADILWGIAEVHRLQDRNPEATTLYTEVIQIREEIGDRSGIADAQLGLAEVHGLRAEYDEAIALYAEVVRIHEELGYRGGNLKADAQRGLASIHRLRHEYDEAAVLYAAAAQMCEEIGDRTGKARAQWGLAEVHRSRKEFDEAAALFTQVFQICEKIGDWIGKADAQRGLAKLHRVRKEYPQSLQLFMESSQVCRTYGNKLGLAYSLRGIGDVYEDQERFEDATEFYEEAAEVFAKIERAKDASRTIKHARYTREKILRDK